LNGRLKGIAVRPYLKSAYLLGVGLILGALATFLLFHSSDIVSRPEQEGTDHNAQMQACLERVIQTMPPDIRMSPALYERFWRLCGNQIFNSLYEDDFRIRRRKFLAQELDERVNLWLVVTITISGVLLAAVQLMLSYRLALKGRAEFGGDSELALQAGKVSLRSSITGAIILALSLAFFMIYVTYIYSIRELNLARPSNLETPVELEKNDQKNTSPNIPLGP
jgi:hypothetical protein